MTPSNSAATMSLEVNFDGVKLTLNWKEELVREDAIVDVVGISVLTEICCFTGVDLTFNTSGSDAAFYIDIA